MGYRRVHVNAFTQMRLAASSLALAAHGNDPAGCHEATRAIWRAGRRLCRHSPEGRSELRRHLLTLRRLVKAGRFREVLAAAVALDAEVAPSADMTPFDFLAMTACQETYGGRGLVGVFERALEGPLGGRTPRELLAGKMAQGSAAQADLALCRRLVAGASDGPLDTEVAVGFFVHEMEWVYPPRSPKRGHYAVLGGLLFAAGLLLRERRESALSAAPISRLA